MSFAALLNKTLVIKRLAPALDINGDPIHIPNNAIAVICRPQL